MPGKVSEPPAEIDFLKIFDHHPYVMGFLVAMMLSMFCLVAILAFIPPQR